MTTNGSAGSRRTDIRPVRADVEFTDVELDPPFVISGRPLTHVTAVRVRLGVRDRAGTYADGLGAGMLSVPWAWPVGDIDLTARDGVLRSLVRRLADQLIAAADAGPPADPYGDPFVVWRPLDAGLDDALADAAREAGVDRIPRLAGLLALGAVDNALHDAWSRAAGTPLYEMYTAEHLREDLGRYAPELAGVHPGDSLGHQRTELPVQHALGVGDPLTDAEAAPGVRSLEGWIRAEGVRHLKLKLTGVPAADAQRIAEVYAVATRQLGDVRLALDPNESYSLPDLEAMLDDVERQDPALIAAIDYLEQPVGRDEHPDPVQLHRLAERIPVLMDEGYSRLEQLSELQEDGWSGVVIKAVKGQSHAMITQALAHARGMKIAIQDLTAVDRALAHSVGLAAALRTSWPPLEYNSRQYAAAANAVLAARSPDLVAVRDGHVRFTPAPSGLHGA